MLGKINLGIAQKQRRFKTLSHFVTESLDWFASNLFINSDTEKDKTSRDKAKSTCVMVVIFYQI